MDFIRSRFGAPVPKVLAWNASSDNQVGCEYIIMEKSSGDVLETHLDHSPAASQQHIFDVARLYDNLASVPFSQYGSIYYKEDLDPSLQARPLYADGVPTDSCAERFRIGPSVERRFYRGGRAHMSIDRGPCGFFFLNPKKLFIQMGLGTNIHSYIKAAVDCEVKWLQSYTKTPSARKQLGAQHTAEQHISLLKKWLLLAPAVIPSPEYCVPVLSHPDMHAGNIFVNRDDSMSLSGIIDWQGAVVRPLFETDVPTFLLSSFSQDLRYEKLPDDDLPPPLFPDDYNQLDVACQKETLAAYKQVESHHHFFKLISQMQPKLYAVMLLRHMEDLRSAIYHSSHSWSLGLPRIEQALVSLATAYGDYIPVSTEYPVSPVTFSEEDMDRNKEEFCDIVLHNHLLENHFLDMMKAKGFKVNPDGMMSTEDFEEAQEAANEILEEAIEGMGEELVRRHWPVREGRLEPAMESCL